MAEEGNTNTEVTDESIISEEVEESEESEESEEESEGKEEEEEETTETSEDEVEVSLRPSYKEIKTKYPNLFKDFPDLRHSIFAETKYREIFPTVEDAQEASENYSVIKELHEKFLGGEVNDLISVFNDIKSSDSVALNDICDGFLPALYKASPEHYDKVTLPIIESLLRTCYKDGSDELKEASKLISKFILGDEDVATGRKTVIQKREQKSKSKDEEEFELRKKNFELQQFSTASKNVSSTVKSKIMKEINSGISVGDNALKELLAEKILSEVDKTLLNNRDHMSSQNRLWEKAADAGFSKDWEDKIITAYLARARTVIPQIRAKIVGKISTGKVTSIDKEVGQTGITNGGSKNGRIPLGKVDYRKTSDADILDDKITLRK